MNTKRAPWSGFALRMMKSITVSLALLAGGAFAAPTPEQVEFFEKEIRPVLLDHCVKCHGPEKQKADLRLDSRAAILKGADTGPVVVEGQPEKSTLIKSIRHLDGLKMPEKAPKLPDAQIAALAEWVKMGMPWPESAAISKGGPDLAKTHWAFQTVKPVAVPKVSDPTAWVKSEVDAFVLDKLKAEKLQPSPIADRKTLMRRAAFVLTGLPPTESEESAFLSDPAPVHEAFAKVVDRLLSSPRYGERWGRHWLDVARYADHRGYLAGNDSREYPFAWTYRDWVIRSLNDDLPYDQFLTRQIAADVEGSGGDKDDLAALGFLTLGRRFLNDGNLIIDDRIDVVTRGTMALTVSCARCHDHKFDPITAKDYYALYGVFASTDEERDPGKLPVLPGGNASEAYEKLRKQRDAEVRQYEQKSADHISAVLRLAGVSVVLPAESVPVLEKARMLTRKYRDERRRLEAKRSQAELNDGAPPRAHVLVEKEKPVNPRVFIRGNPGRPGDAVPRRFLSFLGGDAAPFSKGSGRLELAQALVNPANPLTARVFVNRVWGHHFGHALVRTPGDFGVKTEAPEHLSLLDFLAGEFVRDGWSIKKLHRRILLSSTWMQTSDQSAETQRRDPDNRFLSHQNRRRLDWESLHDSLLAASDELDESMFGRPVKLFEAPHPKRRAVYGYIDRQNLPATLRTFDFASPDLMNPQRSVTNVPQQSLYMLNSPFIMDRASVLASAPEFDTMAAGVEQVQHLFDRVLRREADAGEVKLALDFVKNAVDAPKTTPLWQYGSGRFDGATQRMTFDLLPHWTGNAWQGGAKLPDPKRGWALVNADGGHPAREAGAVKRFTAPRDMVVTLSGRVHRKAEVGNGLVARILSSRKGQIAEWVIEPKGAVGSPVSSLELKAGEIVDFVVESRGDENSDVFEWRTILTASDGSVFSAKDQFRGPQPEHKPLSRWAKFAHVLLQSNEFAFVD
jgi:mono/diheme cytochrome c family protein